MNLEKYKICPNCKASSDVIYDGGNWSIETQICRRCGYGLYGVPSSTKTPGYTPDIYPIPFNVENARAVIGGMKHQTRRPLYVKGRNSILEASFMAGCSSPRLSRLRLEEYWTLNPLAFVKIGDIFWMQEPFASTEKSVLYGATDSIPAKYKLCRAGDMTRNLSRISLVVEEKWFHRIRSITEQDAIAEGMEPVGILTGQVTESSNPVEIASYIEPFCQTWESIYGAESWAENDWVIAFKFKVHMKPVDVLEQEIRSGESC